MTRRTDAVGIFPNDAAITRLIGALLLEQDDERQLQRRYMQLEDLPQLADNQPARLSALISSAPTAQPDERVDLHHSVGRVRRGRNCQEYGEEITRS